MELIRPRDPFECDACKRSLPAAFVVMRSNELGFTLQPCPDCNERIEAINDDRDGAQSLS